MSIRKVGFLALYIVAILGLFFVSEHFWNIHLAEVKAEEERVAAEQAALEAQKAQEELKNKLRTGSYMDSPENLKIVFLTFDDGPNQFSDSILDILKDNDVKATFFNNGREGEEYEEIYKRIVNEGHTMANHTWSHEYSNYDNVNTFLNDVSKLRSYQKEVTGTEPSMVFRFPGGSPNANQECIDAIVNQGYNYVDWNVQFGDGLSDNVTAEEAFQEMIDGVHGESVSVILAHSENPYKAGGREALDAVIKQLKSEGYTFMPIENDFKLPRFTQPTGETSETVPDPGLTDN